MCSDTLRNAQTICAFPACTKTVWKERNGSYSSYCGTNHRNGIITNNSDPLAMCKQCQQRPVYVENGRALDYCGKRCASMAKAGRSLLSPAITGSGMAALTLSTPNNSSCGISGCTQPPFVAQNNTRSGWCSRQHQLLAVQSNQAEACLFCNKSPKMRIEDKLVDYCSQACRSRADQSAPSILVIKDGYLAFVEVANQFMRQWRHNTAVPRVIKVWRILGPKTINDKFDTYKKSVESLRNLPGANSKRRWHGTVRYCRLGDDDSHKTFCRSPACSICRIIKTSFQIARFGARTNFGRFGAGIYTSATSSKANDYISEPGRSPNRAMLLSEVIIGKAIKLTQDNKTLTEAPSGYDSVIGEPGHILNYDECIVYKNEAIRPLFLVIFQ